MIAIAVLCHAGVALAAEVTDMAPAMGASATIQYRGSALHGQLIEAGQVVSDRRVSRHDLDIQGEFSPVDGVGVTLGLATTPSYRLRYPNARGMVSEPADGSGSLLAGDPLAEDPTIVASGLQGVWLGAALSPFSERRRLDGAGSTWRLDVALRTGSKKKNLWTADGDRRGAAPGGPAFRVAGAFSSEQGAGAPYVKVAYVRENPVTVDVVDESGTSYGELDLRPASTVDLRGGVEVIAKRGDEDQAGRIAVDLYGGGGYRSWEDIASGVYLPSVLASGRAISMTAGDHMTAALGMALDVHADAVVRGRTGVELAYASPFRPEHVYAVTTSADTWQINWNVTIQAIGRVAKAP